MANRAWIAPEFMTLTKPIESGIIKYQLHVENTGHEPVVKGGYRFHTYVTPYISRDFPTETYKSMPPNDTCHGLEIGKGDALILYPGTSTKFWLPGDWNAGGDPKAVAAELAARKETLVVEGCIRYDTIAGEKFSSFRFFLRDVPGDSFQKGDDGRLEPAWMFNLTNVGNDAS